MNRMNEVLDLLGIEEGVEYDLIFESGKKSESGPHFRIEDGLNIIGSIDIGRLITGEYKLVPIPWKPKVGELYYYIDFTSEVGYTCYKFFYDSPLDERIVNRVPVYRTEEEVKKAVEDKYVSGEWKRG